jgi:WD40 repeat protein
MQRRLFLFAAVGLTVLGLSACDSRINLPGSTSEAEDVPPISKEVPPVKDIGKPLYQVKIPASPSATAGADHAAPYDPIVIPDSRLQVIYSQDVPAQRDGVVRYLIGREVKEGEPPSDDPNEIVEVVRGKDKKRYHRLKESDRVEKDQLLAILDDRLAQADLLVKASKVTAAEADQTAAKKIKEEYEERNRSALKLRTGGGFAAISEEDVRMAKVQAEKAKYDEVAKEKATDSARAEYEAAKTVVDMHEVRSSIPGVVKTIHKKGGEAVKNLEPILLINYPDRLRAEGLVDSQYLPLLRQGMKAILEPSQPEGPSRSLAGHLQDVTGVAVSKDPAHPLIVSSSEDGTVRVWDRQTGQERRILWHPENTRVLAVACTPPGAAHNWCVSGAADGIGRIWDLDGTGDKPLRELKDADRGHRGAITCVAFSPDGKTCATGGEDHHICLWDAATGALRYRFPAGHRGPVTSIQFTPRSQMVSTGRDNSLRLWTLGENGARLEASTDRRSGDVAVLGVSPDGNEVLFDQGKMLRILSLTKRVPVGILQNPSGASNFTTFALFSPDGRLILSAGGAEGRMQLWRAPSGANRRGYEVRQLVSSDRSAAPTSAAFAPDGTFLVTGGKDRQVMIWPVPSQQEIERELRADVSLVERSIDSIGGQVRIWADLPNPDGRLLPGTTATLTIRPGE